MITPIRRTPELQDALAEAREHLGKLRELRREMLAQRDLPVSDRVAIEETHRRAEQRVWELERGRAA